MTSVDIKEVRAGRVYVFEEIGSLYVSSVTCLPDSPTPCVSITGFDQDGKPYKNWICPCSTKIHVHCGMWQINFDGSKVVCATETSMCAPERFPFNMTSRFMIRHYHQGAIGDVYEIRGRFDDIEPIYKLVETEFVRWHTRVGFLDEPLMHVLKGIHHNVPWHFLTAPTIVTERVAVNGSLWCWILKLLEFATTPNIPAVVTLVDQPSDPCMNQLSTEVGFVCICKL